MKDQHDNQTSELMMDENDGFISEEGYREVPLYDEDWGTWIGYGEGISDKGEE